MDAFALLEAMPRNVARDGPGPPGLSDTGAAVLVGSIVGSIVLMFVVTIAAVAVANRRRKGAGTGSAAFAPGQAAQATVVSVEPLPDGTCRIILTAMGAPGSANGGGMLATTQIVRVTHADAMARLAQGATVPVRVAGHGAQLSLVVELPGVQTLG